MQRVLQASVSWQLLAALPPLQAHTHRWVFCYGLASSPGRHPQVGLLLSCGFLCYWGEEVCAQAKHVCFYRCDTVGVSVCLVSRLFCVHLTSKSLSPSWHMAQGDSTWRSRAHC